MNSNALQMVADTAKIYGKLEAMDEVISMLWQYKNCSTACQKVQAMKTRLELELEMGTKQ